MASKLVSFWRRGSHLPVWQALAVSLALGALFLIACGPAATPAAPPTPVVITKEVVKEVVKEVPVERVVEKPVERVVTKEVLVEKPPGSLTIYSGRSESLVAPIIKQFGQATGIRVAVKYAGTPQLAATLLEEGAKSPADIFFAQDPGGLGAVEHLLAPLPERILSGVPEWARSPQGKWVGVSGRARTVVYNTKILTEADLPDDVFDFADPKWKGRIGWPPTNASFQIMVTAMRVQWGDARTRQWLQGIQANAPKVYPNNTAAVKAAADGEVEVVFVNHYYLFQFIAQQGESFSARNYHPRAGGPGALVMVSGAGILATSQNKVAAERFLEFMLSPVAQQYFAGQTFEYPLVAGVNTHRALVPLDKIRYPQIPLKDLADLAGTQKLLRETGILP